MVGLKYTWQSISGVCYICYCRLSVDRVQRRNSILFGARQEQWLRQQPVHWYIYKVPLREVPRGVAQEQTNTRMKYLHTCLELSMTASHPLRTHTYIFEDRTTVLLLFVEIVKLLVANIYQVEEGTGGTGSAAV